MAYFTKIYAKYHKKINENNDNIKAKFAEANKANSMTDKPGMKEAAQLATIEGAGLQEMNEKLLPLQRNMKTVLGFMEKVSSSADYIIKETEIKVKLKEAEYEIVKSSSNALKTAISIFCDTQHALMYTFIYRDDHFSANF